MITRYSSSWVLLLLIFTVGCSDYAYLSQDLDNYRPPVYTFLSPTEKAERPEGSLNTDFEREKKQLEKEKALWGKALKAPRKETSFFSPSPRLLKTLKPAAKDGKAALEALAHPYSLESLETLVFLRNPLIQSARDHVRAAIDTYSQVMALDDILRQISAFTKTMMTDVGPVKGKAPMRTLFPFPGVLSLKGEIVTQSVREAFEQLEITLKTAVTDARKVYWNLLYRVKAEGITRGVLDLYRHLERIAASRYETGRTSYQDVIKVRIRREILEEDLKTVIEKEQNAKSRILALLNLPPDAHLSRPEDRNPPEAVPPLNGLYKTAHNYRQELKRMRNRIRKMERLIELAETRILPQYTLGLSFYEDITTVRVGTSAQKADFPVSTRASRGAGLPLKPWYGIDDAYIRETRQTLNALKKELQNAEAATDLLVREAWYRLDLAKRDETPLSKKRFNAGKGRPRCLHKRVRDGKRLLCGCDRLLRFVSGSEPFSRAETERHGHCLGGTGNGGGRPPSSKKEGDESMKAEGSGKKSVPLAAIVIGTVIVTLLVGGGIAYISGYLTVPMAPVEKASHSSMEHAQKDEPKKSSATEDKKGKILYWRAPMNPTEIYDKPGKSAMGMDLVPVYAGETSRPGEVRIDPVIQQDMGVRFGKVKKGPLIHMVRTYGIVTPDETLTAQINLKTSGWIEKIYVDFTGKHVKKGDPLFELYSPELVEAQEGYLAALRTPGQPGTQGNRLLDSARKQAALLRCSGRIYRGTESLRPRSNDGDDPFPFKRIRGQKKRGRRILRSGGKNGFSDRRSRKGNGLTHTFMNMSWSSSKRASRRK